MNECIVSIHQPLYWPWLGFMDKLVSSDVHVVLDNVKFDRGEYQHRTKYRAWNRDTVKYLTIPYDKATRNNVISEVLLPSDTSWYRSHLGIIYDNYKGSPCFHEVFELVESVYSRMYRSLADLNIAILRFLISLLDIKVKLVEASEIGTERKKTELNLDYTVKTGGTMYLSGIGAKAYMDDELFKVAGVGLRYQEFEHPVYCQYPKGFVGGLFVLDMLFNLGVEGSKDRIHKLCVT